jgi:hypothetical protein
MAAAVPPAVPPVPFLYASLPPTSSLQPEPPSSPQPFAGRNYTEEEVTHDRPDGTAALPNSSSNAPLMVPVSLASTLAGLASERPSSPLMPSIVSFAARWELDMHGMYGVLAALTIGIAVGCGVVIRQREARHAYRLAGAFEPNEALNVPTQVCGQQESGPGPLSLGDHYEPATTSCLRASRVYSATPAGQSADYPTDEYREHIPII